MLLPLFFLCLAGTLSAQGVNMTLVGHVNYQTLHSANLNDCWGYVDETGIEYALVGTTDGTSIVSLADPANPVEIYWLPGPHSTWRDLQVYGDYLYVTTEAAHGMEIIDMSPLPGSTALPVTTYIGNGWLSAHDVFIDTAGGWAYVLGANRGNGGTIILDIHTDPMSPIEVGAFDYWYTHDAFAQGNLLYNAHIYDGFFSVVDVTDPANPVLIETKNTPHSFSHNIWVTPDDHYAVTGDEVAGAYLTLYDVSNPNAIVETDRIRTRTGADVSPHNTFITSDSLIVSAYYQDGVRVYDMRRPHNLVEVASYDTYPSAVAGFNGSWGTYPYFPSGLIIASDMATGLFVLGANVQRPSWYEGLVRDAVSSTPLSDALVEIDSDPQTGLTDALGKYAVGTAAPGPVNVTFSKYGYYPQTIAVPFATGVLLTDTIDLVPMAGYPLQIVVEEAGTGNPIVGAKVRLSSSQAVLNGATNGFGESDFTMYSSGVFIITAGKWGYVTSCAYYGIEEPGGTVTIQLEKGWYDDFTFDFGWTTTFANTVTGLWTRGIPADALSDAAPFADYSHDCDGYAFVTGNTPQAG